jgi:uncharacterized Ntn-hydrolase superfamily protein
MVDVRYGPLGLQLMSSGKGAKETLESLLHGDPHGDSRQVAMVDSRGEVAVHTGSKCIPHAGHASGKGFSCQGNIMKTSKVWGAMAEAYEKGSGLQLPERLVAALEAGEGAGGDARGKQSSAILVVGKQLKAAEWEGKIVELRVEDHPRPVPELARLLRYQRGYEWVNRGDELLTSEKYEEALKAYEKGLELVPEVLELKYWVGLSMIQTRERDRGIRMVREVFAKEKNYVNITRGIVKTQSPPISPEVARKLFD